MKIINLIRERKSEGEVWVDTFSVEDRVQNPEQSLRDAVCEYLRTPAEIDAIGWATGDFNWWDAIMFVPNDIWNKHGFIPLGMNAINIIVSQDEVLCEGDESVVS